MVRVRKDDFLKNYGLLPDGCIPADPKDALWLREGRKEGRKEEHNGWSQKASLFITICILSRPRGPDDRKGIPPLGEP